MSLLVQSGPRRLHGFTLLESTIAIVISISLGYVLTVVLGISRHSERTVVKVAAEDADFRDATDTISRELRASTDAQVTVTLLPDGNNQVQFMIPLVAGGVVTWGVHDRMLGNDQASQDRQGWCFRYTVRSVVSGGVTTRQLVRQILDTTMTVQREKVLATGLRSGTQTPPGFRVAKTGAVWEITLTTEALVENKTQLGGVFHVRTRN
jgi:type II secretory pathway pseudopilin PulG